MLAMAREVVLVNGFPGSGKSTTGAALAGELDAPLLSKDRIKEALASVVSFPGPRTAAMSRTRSPGNATRPASVIRSIGTTGT